MYKFLCRAQNFDLYVKDIIKYKWDTTDNPIKEKSEFKSLSLREKVELILAICEYRLDTEDVVELLKVFCFISTLVLCTG